MLFREKQHRKEIKRIREGRRSEIRLIENKRRDRGRLAVRPTVAKSQPGWYIAPQLLINEAINCVDWAIEEIFSEVQTLSRFTPSLLRTQALAQNRPPLFFARCVCVGLLCSYTFHSSKQAKSHLSLPINSYC